MNLPKATMAALLTLFMVVPTYSNPDSAPDQADQEGVFVHRVKSRAEKLREAAEQRALELLLWSRDSASKISKIAGESFGQYADQLKELLTGEAPLTPEQKLENERKLEVMLAAVKFELNKMQKQEPKIRDYLGEHKLDGTDGFINGEWEAIKSGVDAVVKTIAKRSHKVHPPSQSPEGVSKGDHGKSQACLTGKIKFHSQIDADLQRGVVMPNVEYAVESRISMAEELSRSDRSSVGRGVALKLKNISKIVGNKKRLPDFPRTDEQDFLMTMPEVFFVRNIVEYSYAFAMRAELSVGNLRRALSVDKIRARLVDEFSAMARKNLNITSGVPQNILAESYFSKHPYAWGEDQQDSKAVKYSVAPCDLSTINKTPPLDQHNYQSKFIEEALDKNGEVCFHFRIQRRPVDANLTTEELKASYPIEDGNVKWDESKAPFVNVATVTFTKADNPNWNSPEELAKCHERDEFTPWNGLQAHQPMSNLARGRRYVYRASALVRQLNKDNTKIKPEDQLPKLNP